MGKEKVVKLLRQYSVLRKTQPVLRRQIDSLKKIIEQNPGDGNGPERLKSVKRMESAYRLNESMMQRMDNAIEFLDGREKSVLWHFYINRTPEYMDLLAERLAVERSQIYRIKDRALSKLEAMYFGTLR